MIREHPPTAAAAIAAVLASLAADLEPYLAGMPLISEGTAQLALVVAVGVAGWIVGKVAERWTVPWYPSAEDALDSWHEDPEAAD